MAQWKIKTSNGGGRWNGEITVLAGAYPIVLGAEGKSPAQALARAAVIADQLTQSPIFAAVAPPGTMAAIAAIKALASSKDLRRTLRKFGGPGAQRLARSLRRFF